MVYTKIANLSPSAIQYMGLVLKQKDHFYVIVIKMPELIHFNLANCYKRLTIKYMNNFVVNSDFSKT